MDPILLIHQDLVNAASFQSNIVTADQIWCPFDITTAIQTNNCNSSRQSNQPSLLKDLSSACRWRSSHLHEAVPLEAVDSTSATYPLIFSANQVALWSSPQITASMWPLIYWVVDPNQSHGPPSFSSGVLSRESPKFFFSADIGLHCCDII